MIATMQLSSLAKDYDWQLLGADLSFNAVSTDSRDITKQSLFVALPGENFDGHDYVAKAAKSGAVAALLSIKCDADLPQLVCSDTLKGIACLAKTNVQQFAYPLVALTGSAGKTTTKTMLAHILSQVAPTLATQGNLNNEIGAPLTALAIAPEHRFAVIEMGAAKRGDIAYLCDYIKPSVALVTNAGDAHIEGFGSEQGIAEGKGEIYQALVAGDTAIVNADSPFKAFWSELAAHTNIITFACSNEADVTAENIALDISGSTFTLCYAHAEQSIRLRMPGRHNVANALAAAATSLAVGIKLDVIAAGLNSFDGVASRLSTLLGLKGSTVINDSYNANPSAFKAAIDVLVCAPTETVLVMGDMAELGDHSDQGHRDVGLYAKAAGVDYLLAVGEKSQAAVEAFGARAQCYKNKTELQTALLAQLHSNQTLLVKGSRSAAMETVVEHLVGVSAAHFSRRRGGSC